MVRRSFVVGDDALPQEWPRKEDVFDEELHVAKQQLSDAVMRRASGAFRAGSAAYVLQRIVEDTVWELMARGVRVGAFPSRIDISGPIQEWRRRGNHIDATGDDPFPEWAGYGQGGPSKPGPRSN